MIHTTDSLALLRTICDQPDEDTPRLMYADWLDALPPVRVTCPNCKGFGHFNKDNDDWNSCQEQWQKYPSLTVPHCNNSGTIIDTANADRAEFIRVQCELTSFVEPIVCDEAVDRVSFSPTYPFDKWEHLFAREAALLKQYETAWRKGPKATCPDCVHWKGRVPKDCQCGGSRRVDTGGLLRKFTTGRIEDGASETHLVGLTWGRGFIRRVTVPALADVVDERLVCEACGDSRGAHGRQYCYKCDSPRLTRVHVPTPWAVAALTATPERGTIQELVCLDRTPRKRVYEKNSGLEPWFYTMEDMPEPIFFLMEGDFNVDGEEVEFDTHELAVTALGWATAKFIRKNAR